MDTIIRFLPGPTFILAGLWFIALPFGFALMIFGDRESPPTWWEYLGAVSKGGLSSISLGFVLVVGGVYVAVARDRRSGQGNGTEKV